MITDLIFIKVSAKQLEMEGKFVAMNRTVNILNVYKHTLADDTQQIHASLPNRWTNLKTKVSQAKIKIGPRIREESASISKVNNGVYRYSWLLPLTV